MFLGYDDDDVSLNPREQWPDAARASSSSASYQSWDDDYWSLQQWPLEFDAIGAEPVVASAQSSTTTASSVPA